MKNTAKLLIVAALACALLLAGCGNSASSSGASESAASSESTASSSESTATSETTSDSASGEVAADSNSTSETESTTVAAAAGESVDLTGTVQDATMHQFTLVLADGTTEQVLLTDDTTTELTDGITEGASVAVTGTRDDSGAIEAATLKDAQ